MAERDFDEEFANDEREGHTFVLGGQKFHTLPVTTPQAWLAMFTSNETGSKLEQVIAYIRMMLIPEDVEAFDALVSGDNQTVLVSAAQIDDIASWLFEVTTQRPTKAPASSGGGRRKTSA